MEIQVTVNQVLGFKDLPVKLPKNLESAISRRAELNQTPFLTVQTPDLSTGNLADAVAVMAEQQAAVEAEGKARQKLSAELDRAVIGAASQSVPDLFDQLHEKFVPAAQAYTEAVSKLPEGLTPDTLMNSSTELSDAFHTAKAQVPVFAAVEQFLKTVYGHLHRGIVSPGTALKMTRPATMDEYTNLVNVRGVKHSSAIQQIHPLMFTAVKLGVSLEMHTAEEAGDLDEHLRSEAQRLAAEQYEARKATAGASNRRALKGII